MRSRLAIVSSLLFAVGSSTSSAADLTPEQVEFFEQRIRPVLAQDCYECHQSGEKVRAGLALDSREGLLAGGDSGPVIVPGDPGASLLIKAIRHEAADEDLKMPKAGPQLEAEVIADFEKWVAMGAPDPRDVPTSAEQIAADTDWQAVLERRKSWWSFQPVRDPLVPEVGDTAWSKNSVDRFIKAKLDAGGLEPVAAASAEVLVRRLYFALIGLPPTPQQVDEFVAAHGKDADAATAVLVDRLLGDERFGERWARHWMDWMRYAETHGSEGDPAIPHAWRYRDYLIRALNADVPYDQLLHEHVAGDVLTKPRINATLGLNESTIGAAPWRFVLHGFAPTDALDEQVRFTDDQINTFSKAFLGLTISCARCHDHKFDAISQTDFYALFGILKTCRPALVTADAPGVLEKNRQALAKLKPQLREAIGAAWSAPDAADALASRILHRADGFEAAKGGLRDLTWSLAAVEGDEAKFSAAWKKIKVQWLSERGTWQRWKSSEAKVRWDFSQAMALRDWSRDGEGLRDGASAAGEFSLGDSEDRLVRGIYPAGVFSHLLSDKHRAVLQSPNLDLDGEYELWLHTAGDDEAMARYVVRNYPRNGTVYPLQTLKGDGVWGWQNWSLKYWDGDRIFVELTTAADSAVLAKTGRDRSWFGLREVVMRRKPDGGGKPAQEQPVRNFREFLQPIFSALDKRAPQDAADFAARCAGVVADIAGRWGRGEVLTDAEALLLNECLAKELLANRVDEIPSAMPLLTDYRQLEAAVPVATRVPGVLESKGEDQALFVRGDHRQPGDLVPRRFLEAIDAKPYESEHSGRLELAADLTRADNPFTSRVLVNRVWHYLFGSGLVRTTDNFGRLGEKPSHPQLLDHLATRFVVGGWSMKKLIRELVLTRTWQLDSTPSLRAAENDPENRLLSHANLRRLEAEAIRDALLAVSGELDAAQFGTPTDGNTLRRAIYIQQRRNNLDPFLAAFDAPVPTSTKGRRDVTNVPAQSLAMLNGAFVRARAEKWAASTGGDGETAVEARIERLFREAIGRRATAAEVSGARALLEAQDKEQRSREAAQQALTAGLEAGRTELKNLIAPVRERLLAEAEAAAGPAGSGAVNDDPGQSFAAIGQWLFDADAADSVSGLQGSLQGDARLDEGALVVDGGGYFASEPLPFDLAEKSFEVWVQLDGLKQRGGGVMGVQDLRGGAFDSIVWAERKAKRWLAGSNNHRRTLDFGGADELEAGERAVHLVMTYAADGTIRGYRDGAAYGEAIRKAELQPFKAGQSQVVFGLRHGTSATGNRPLKGRILEARLYDRVLEADEVSALASGDAAPRGFVSEKQVRAALSPAQREKLERLERELAGLEKDLAEYRGMGATLSPWAGLAHAVFNLKEFVYLR